MTFDLDLDLDLGLTIYMSRCLNIKMLMCADVYMYRYLNFRRTLTIRTLTIRKDSNPKDPDHGCIFFRKPRLGGGGMEG